MPGTFGSVMDENFIAQSVKKHDLGMSGGEHKIAGMASTNFGDLSFIFVGGNDVQRSLVQFDPNAIGVTYPMDKATPSGPSYLRDSKRTDHAAQVLALLADPSYLTTNTCGDAGPNSRS